MKNRMIIKTIFVVLMLALVIVSCKENEPKGDEFNWSSDGKKLALVNLDSKELLVAEIEGEKISQMTVIDSCVGEKAMIYAPAWSSDGKNLLYSKSSKTALEIFVYSLNKKNVMRIDRIAVDEKIDVRGKAFARWSPKMNRVLWLSWNDLAEHFLFAGLPDGTDRKLLIKISGDRTFPFPAWSPDGEWIAYSSYAKEAGKNNGLWKMKYDGSGKQQIFPADEITAFQWAPDGSHLAVVKKAVIQTTKEQSKSIDSTFQYQLSLIDLNGKNARLISEENLPILKLAWSPDGNQLAFLQEKDESRDLWIVNLDSNRKVKLNFIKVKDFFGWNSANQIFYTTDFPDELVRQTKDEKEARELFDDLKGVQKENLFFMSDHGQLKKMEGNIYAFNSGGQDGAVAYYKIFKPDVMSGDLYYPVIAFASGQKAYPARTKAQQAAAADELCRDEKYPEALDYLGRYWNFDLNSADFRTRFDADRIIEKMNADRDSSQFRMLRDGLEDRTLLRTILTLRKMKQTENADWLFDQFKKLVMATSQTEKDKKKFLDGLFWSLMGIYGRYGELTSGLTDLDSFLSTENADSIFIMYANYAQSLMAFGSKQYDYGLQKLQAAIQFLPRDMAELDDIKDLLSFYVSKLDGKKEAEIVSILQQTVQRFPDDQNVFEIYDMLGDRYLKNGQREKALEAYRNAVTAHFDQHEIWRKILGMR